MDALLGEQLLMQELVLELGLAGGRGVAAVRVDCVRHGYLSM